MQLQPRGMPEAAAAFMVSMRARRESPDNLPGISTGLDSLDDAIGGWRKGHLIYLGGLPGRGKSAVMTQFAYAAATAGVPCGYVSLEMTEAELMGRLATIHSGLLPDRFQDAKKMREDEWTQAKRSVEGTGGICDLPIALTDLGGLYISQVAVIIRRMHRNGAQVVFVDFLQTIRHEVRDVREAIGAVSAVLRDLVKKLQSQSL